jgi:Zn-dependent protease
VAPEPAVTAAAARSVCRQCGSEVAPTLLSCPGCHSLVHAGELKRLADEARRAAEAGDTAAALAAWRQASDLLPPGSRQYAQISERIDGLSRQLDGAPVSRAKAAATAPAAAKTKGARRSLALPSSLAALGLLGLFLWKFKFVLVFVLTKAKLLLMGLSKSTTLFSMLLAFGAYWTIWGWKFAAGLVVSIYVHEMGHVFALGRYGIAASAPMFVPGLGAFIRSKRTLVLPREDARVGLAGPLWGLGTALAAYGVFWATQAPIWAAIAKVGAWINLFNLLPLFPLDGGRGFSSLTRPQRWLATAAIGAAYYGTGEGLLVLLLIVAAARALQASAPTEPDHEGLLQYVLLVAALSAMTTIPVPLGSGP